MSNSNFDVFPPNIGEYAGKIERLPFSFKVTSFQVWQSGKVIYKSDSSGYITTELKGNTSEWMITGLEVDKYINCSFKFDEISTNLDRIMWSRDIFNSRGLGSEYGIPDIGSLFFVDGKLKQIGLTVHNPNILIEFFTDSPESIQIKHEEGVPQTRFSNQELFAVLQTIDAIILADGVVEQEELHFLHNLMEELNFNLEDINQARALDANESVGILKSMSIDKRKRVFQLCSQVALADGDFHDHEADLLTGLLMVLSLEEESSQDATFSLNDVYFKSSDHLRYEHGVHVSGPHGGASRAIQVKAHDSIEGAYLVTVFNLEGNHPLWGNNVQMAPKQMKITRQSDSMIELVGFGEDPRAGGHPAGRYSNYGLVLKLKDNEINSVILQFRDRGVMIKYLQ